MDECKKCGRPLTSDEKRLCPACKRKRVDIGKNIVKGAGAVLGAAVVVAGAVLGNKKG